MRCALLGLVAFALGACASPPPPRRAGPEPRPIPADLRRNVSTSEVVGEAMYEQFVRSGGAIDPVLDVDAKRARATALARPHTGCTEAHRALVIRSPSGTGAWLVYVLGVGAQPGDVVIGGHRRVVVSADGTSVLDDHRLSEGCLTLPYPETQPSGRVAAFYVRHSASDWPLETHVFLSQLHRLPFYVGTARGLWKVHGSRTTFYGPARLSDRSKSLTFRADEAP